MGFSMGYQELLHVLTDHLVLQQSQRLWAHPVRAPDSQLPHASPQLLPWPGKRRPMNDGSLEASSDILFIHPNSLVWGWPCPWGARHGIVGGERGFAKGLGSKTPVLLVA